MGRMYTIPFGPITNVQESRDLFEILAGSGRPFCLHEVVFGQVTAAPDPSPEELAVTIYKATAGYTTGAGGSGVIVPNKVLGSDAAFGGTVKAYNTTLALPGGGALNMERIEPWQVQSAFQYLPVPEDRLYWAGGEACVVRLSAPADAMVLVCTAVLEEFG